MLFASLTIACETFRKQLSFLENNVPKRARFNEAWRRFPFADTLACITFMSDVEKQTVTLYVTDYTNTVAVTYLATTNSYLMISVNARKMREGVDSLTGSQVRFRVEPQSLILSDDTVACVSIQTLAEDHTATIDYATLRQEPTIAFEAAKLIPVLKGLVPFAHQAEGHETNSIFFDAGRLSAQDGSCYAYQTFETQGVRGLVPLHTIKQLIALASKSKGSVGVWHSDDRLIFVVEDVRLIALLRPRRLAFELSDLIEKFGPRDLLVWLELKVRDKSVSRNIVAFAKPKHMELTDPAIATRVKAAKDGTFLVTLAAKRPALYAWLELMEADARFSDNFIHLAPGQPVEIEVRPEAPMTAARLAKVLRVRSLVDTY